MHQHQAQQYLNNNNPKLTYDAAGSCEPPNTSRHAWPMSAPKHIKTKRNSIKTQQS
jgi:hypothetical protein